MNYGILEDFFYRKGGELEKIILRRLEILRDENPENYPTLMKEEETSLSGIRGDENVELILYYVFHKLSAIVQHEKGLSFSTKKMSPEEELSNIFSRVKIFFILNTIFNNREKIPENSTFEEAINIDGILEESIQCYENFKVKENELTRKAIICIVDAKLYEDTYETVFSNIGCFSSTIEKFNNVKLALGDFVLKVFTVKSLFFSYRKFFELKVDNIISNIEDQKNSLIGQHTVRFVEQILINSNHSFYSEQGKHYKNSATDYIETFVHIDNMIASIHCERERLYITSKISQLLESNFDDENTDDIHIFVEPLTICFLLKLYLICNDDEILEKVKMSEISNLFSESEKIYKYSLTYMEKLENVAQEYYKQKGKVGLNILSDIACL